MKYKPYALLSDGWKLDLGNEFGDQKHALQCAYRRLEELKGNDVCVVISGKSSNDKWERLYKNFWKYRLIRFFNRNYTIRDFIGNL